MTVSGFACRREALAASGQQSFPNILMWLKLLSHKKENFECLKQNIPKNVVAYRQALGEQSGFVDTKRDACEAGNAGAWYTVPGTKVYQGTIDGLGLDECDLIQLDVEGAEAAVVRGGLATIKRFKPVIVIEEKRLPHVVGDYREARKLLETFGYKQVAKLHKDVVFKC